MSKHVDTIPFVTEETIPDDVEATRMTAEELAAWDAEIADLKANRDISRRAHRKAKATGKDVGGRSQRQWWNDYVMYRDAYKEQKILRRSYG